MAKDINGGHVVVTADPDTVSRADRIVLPGDGAFPHCAATLKKDKDLFEALEEAVKYRAKPFLGICVGMQLLAGISYEFIQTSGLGWLNGKVSQIMPSDDGIKIPHMGWNDLILNQEHPVLEGIKTGDHAYFVHSYHMILNDSDQVYAHVEYGQDVNAVVGIDTIVGTQFHPEKSQATGLKIISNFLQWNP